MSDKFDSIPVDLLHDLNEIIRKDYAAGLRFAKSNGVPVEFVRQNYGPSPEEKAAAAAAEAKRLRRDKRRAWWSAQWVAFVALIVAVLSLLVALFRD